MDASDPLIWFISQIGLLTYADDIMDSSSNEKENDAHLITTRGVWEVFRDAVWMNTIPIGLKSRLAGLKLC